MDGFVVRKRKPNEIDDGESSESTPREKRPVTNIHRLPVENNKPKEVNRKFHAEWENQFFVCEYKNNAICLICRHDFTDFRKYVFERHFKNKHSVIDANYPLSSKKRADEISRLKNELSNEQKVVKKFTDANELLARASYEIAFEIAKRGKPYSDGDFHKQLMQSSIETICENWDAKQKTTLLNEVKKIPHSCPTISRRVIEIGSDLEANLKRDLEQCVAFSIALDETTDIKDDAQLLFWVRYFIDDRIEEDILALVALREHTTAQDIFDAFETMAIDRFNLNLKKLASICTDGAPSMRGTRNGFTALVKRYVAQHFDNHHLITYHCIIHQENLCAKALQKHSNVLETVTKVCVMTIYVFLYVYKTVLLIHFVYSFFFLNLDYQ